MLTNEQEEASSFGLLCDWASMSYEISSAENSLRAYDSSEVSRAAVATRSGLP